MATSRTKERAAPITVLFHEDFDGIASAVLAIRLFRDHLGIAVAGHSPVDYSMRPGWLKRDLGHAAVVDFLYHPRADWWWDHHETTFLLEEHRRRFRQDPPRRVWSPAATSCAIMLVEIFRRHYEFESSDLAELVEWADRIDSARYDSPEQAVESSEPALRINMSFLSHKTPGYLRRLVSQLEHSPLEEVARCADVERHYRKALGYQTRGLEEFRCSAELVGSTVVFRVSSAQDRVFNRYFPYYVFPAAACSVGAVCRRSSVKITAMSNPWRPHPGRLPHLGQLFAAYGGGGHRRVGSVVLTGRDRGNIEEILSRVLAATVQPAMAHGVV